MTSDRRAFVAAAGAVGVASFLTFHGYWTPGGDSDLYAAVARNLARGDGYTYAGEPVKIIPPGWTVFLAGLMRITAAMWFLKLAQCVMLGAGLLLLYPVLRRYASPTVAATAVGATAFLHPVYPLATWLHSEPLFLALGNAAVLLTMRFADGGSRRWWWLAGVCVLLAATVLVRYSGIFGWILVAAILASRPGVRWPSRLVPMAITGLVTLVTLAIVLWAVRPTTEAKSGFVDEDNPQLTTESILQGAKPPADWDGAATTSEAVDATTRPDLEEEAVVQESRGHGNPLASAERRTPVLEYLRRAASPGTWVSWGLWYPTRFASGVSGANVLVGIVGWLAVAAMSVFAWRRAKAGHWLPIGMLAFVGAFAMLWPNANARYLLPVLPMLIAFGIEGVRHIAGRRGAVIFVATIALANLPLFAVDVVLAKRPSLIPSRFEAGTVAGLVAATDVMRSANVADGELAVSHRHINFDKIRPLPTGSRAAVFLLDVAPRPMPAPVPDEPWDPWLAVWMREQGVRFYLYQEPAVPWRLWHFRMPTRLFEALAGREVNDVTGGWQLWELREGTLVRVPLTPATITNWPRRVPGLE